MVNSVVDVFNLAGASIGTRSTIASESEVSREREEFSLWYPVARDQVLAAAHWPSTRKTVRLALHKERDTNLDWADGDPEPGYAFAYSVPPDMLHAWYLSTFDRFTIGLTSDNKKCIMTNREDAVLTYAMRQETVGMWDQDLKIAVAHALGAYTALKLTGKPRRVQQAEEKANRVISEAIAQSIDQLQDEWAGIAVWHQARGYASSQPTSRYIFPYGPMINVTGGVSVQ